MKKLRALFCLFNLALFILPSARAIDQLTDLPTGSTNSFIVDTSASSLFALTLSATGAGDATTQAQIGFTNNPTAGMKIGVSVGGTVAVYSWQTSPVTFTTNTSGSGTNLVIGFTNGTANSDLIAITLNGVTNTFQFSNSPSAASDVLTNSTTAGSATNLFLVLGAYYNDVQVSGSIVTVKSGLAGSITSTNSLAATNNTVIYYTATNLIATNSLQIATAASAPLATTNLYNKLLADYPNTLSLSFSSPTQIVANTKGNPGFAFTNTVAALTNINVTNAITGNISALVSNSVDKVDWFRDTTKEFSLAFSNTTTVGLASNYSAGAYPYYKFTLANSNGTYCTPVIRVKTSTKPGL